MILAHEAEKIDQFITSDLRKYCQDALIGFGGFDVFKAELVDRKMSMISFASSNEIKRARRVWRGTRCPRRKCLYW